MTSMNGARHDHNSDRELCAEILNGSAAAMNKLMVRYAQRIQYVASARFRRDDMAGDLEAALRTALSARENFLLTQWLGTEKSMAELIEKEGARCPLIDS